MSPTTLFLPCPCLCCPLGQSIRPKGQPLGCLKMALPPPPPGLPRLLCSSASCLLSSARLWPGQFPICSSELVPDKTPPSLLCGPCYILKVADQSEITLIHFREGALSLYPCWIHTSCRTEPKPCLLQAPLPWTSGSCRPGLPSSAIHLPALPPGTDL